MDANARAPLPAPVAGNRNVDRAIRWLQKAPEGGGAPVAHDGILPTREDSGHPSPLTRKTEMTYRVYAAVHTVQAAGFNPAANNVPAYSRSI